MNSPRLLPPLGKSKTSQPKGFALIIALTLMSFMVVLILSLATFLNVEMGTTTHQNKLEEARANALYGAQVALGQLQIYAGRDQAVTAEATIAYPEKTSPGVGEMWDIYRDNAIGMNVSSGSQAPAGWRTFLAEDYNDTLTQDRDSWEAELDAWWDGKNPHWLGVWKSGTRNESGSLVNNGDFDRGQTPHWLISGNEFHTGANISTQLTPDQVLDPSDPGVAILVGYGSAAAKNPDSSSDPAALDGLEGRVLAPKVPITDTDDIIKGEYAYWIGDENTKANFSIIDPYYDAPSGSKEYRNRLQVPQRLGWEQISGFKEIYDSYDGNPTKQAAMVNDDALERIETTSQIVLVNPDPDDQVITDKYQDSSRQNFHHITGFSTGLFTDTALGGLQKDLSGYFELGQNFTHGGISDSNPIPDPDGLDLFKYRNDPRFGVGNDGFPNNGKEINIPTWGDLREWYTNEVQGPGQGAIDVDVATTPVLTQVRLFVGFSTDGNDVRLNVLPQIVLWNPYDTGLEAADYDIRIKFAPKFEHFRIASETNTPTTPNDTIGTTREYTKGKFFYNHKLTGGIGTVNDTFDHLWRALDPKVLPGDPLYPQYEYHPRAIKIAQDHPNLSPVRMIPAPSSIYPENEPIFFDSYDIQIYPEENELSLRFRTDFKAGEHLIFTVGTDQPIQEATSQIDGDKGTPISIIELENVFDTNFPASAYVHFANKDMSTGSGFKSFYWADSARFLPPPSDEFQIRIIVNDYVNRDYGSFGNLGGAGGFMSNFNGIRTEALTVDQPMLWPIIYDEKDFSAAIKGNVDTNLNITGTGGGGPRTGPMEIPIMLVGENWMDPLYYRGLGTIDTAEAGATSFRPFANYNIMAKQFTSNNPMVDGVRHQANWANGNAGGGGMARFEAINGIISRNNSQPKVIDFFTGQPIGQPNSIGDDKSSTYSNVKPVGDSSDSVDRGNPWNAWGAELRAEDVGGRARAFSFIQPTKLPSGTARNAGSNPLVDALSIVPTRLAYRPEFDIISLGQLQQVNLSEFLWQPANPIGNSEASPYIDRDMIAGLTSRPVYQYFQVDTDNMPVKDAVGNYKTGTKAMRPGGVPNNRFNLLVDTSYLLNESLWDRYFFSTIPQVGSIDLDNNEPLGNNRIKFDTSKSLSEDKVRDFDNAAGYLYNSGAFNINSTSVEAWKALLTAFRDIQIEPQSGIDTNPIDTVPVSRSLSPLAGAVDFTSDIATNIPSEYGAGASPTGYNNYDKAFGGYRYMTDAMIETLAERIVDEVRLRGPFYSMADFVNRRLVNPDGLSRNGSGNITYTNSYYVDARKDKDISTEYDALIGLQGLSGPIQRAIDVSGINGGVNYPNTASHSAVKKFDAMYATKKYSKANTEGWSGEWHWVAYPSLGWYTDSEARAGAPVGEQGLLLSHSPSFITQGDLLAMLGPVLRPRGDTFVIRSYGSAINKLTGEVDAEAWLEMTVQRVVDPLYPDPANPLEPVQVIPGQIDYGRKFEIVNFRWLTADEV